MLSRNLKQTTSSRVSPSAAVVSSSPAMPSSNSKTHKVSQNLSEIRSKTWLRTHRRVSTSSQLLLQLHHSEILLAALCNKSRADRTLLRVSPWAATGKMLSLLMGSKIVSSQEISSKPNVVTDYLLLI